jgi:signal transduction histidine kinase
VTDTHNPVACYIRAEVDTIVHAWEVAVTQRLPQLRRLDRAVVIYHLPEFLIGLAAWLDGDEVEVRHEFDELVQGHALQRLGYGIDLASVTTEYQVLRNVILVQLMILESSRHVRDSVIRLNEGLDYSVIEAIRRYTAMRDQVRERFIGILAHDLRNPVSAVSVVAALIASRPCNEPDHGRTATIIQRSADRMMRMIADVVDFAHAHLGQGIPVFPRAADMGKICEEAAQELRLGNPTRGIRVNAIGDLRGRWDHDRVIQALSNLIGNAIQHGEDPIEVTARARDDNAVITSVTNRGRAIPPETLAHLFDPFRRGREDGDRSPSSLGLGLYIVQQIAAAHGGVCTVSSDDRQTSFEICWPRAPIEARPDRGDAAPRSLRQKQQLSR